MSTKYTPEARAAWLNLNHAPKDWLIVTVEEKEELRAEIARLTAENAALKSIKSNWEDKEDEWTPAIDAAHPMSKPGHMTHEESDRYKTAMKMVGHRHGKYALINLVNWLLERAAKSEDAAARKNAAPK